VALTRLVKFFAEPIAYTALGLDVARILGFCLYLLSEMPDVRIDRTSSAAEIRTPNLAYDLLPTENPAGVSRKDPKDVELRRGKTDHLAPNQDLTTQDVHHEAGEHESLLQGLGV
jgi:hypothetical protein